MPDTTVEIYNNTLLWGNYSSNAQTLFTTDASTRYVVKDIQIDNNTYPSATAPNILVNNTRVATLNGNLTGSEIVDVSSTVAAGFDTSSSSFISINNFYNNNQYAHNVTDGGVFTVANTLSPGIASLNTATTTSSWFNNYNVVTGVWTINGNVYYAYFDSNSTTGLYRRTGGANGTDTGIFTSSYSPVAFDGVSKFFIADASGNFLQHDAITNTTTTLASAAYAGSTYPLLMYSNGYLFWSAYSGINIIVWCKVSTGQTGQISTGSFNYNNYNGYAAFYNSTTGTVRFHLGTVLSFNQPYYWIEFNIAGSTPTFVATGFINNSSILSFRYNSYSALGTNYAIMLGSSGIGSRVYLVDSNMSVVASKTISNANFGTSQNAGSFQIINPTNTVKNALGPTMKLRITGVKQT